MSITADGSMLATTNFLETLVWDLSTPTKPTVLHNLTKHNNGYPTVSADGSLVALALHSSNVSLYSFDPRVDGGLAKVASLQGPEPADMEGFPIVAISGDGSTLVMTDATNKFGIHYDLTDLGSEGFPADKDVTVLMEADDITVMSLSLDYTGDLLAAGRPDDSIVKDMSGAAHTAVYSSTENKNAGYSLLSSDGNVLANSGPQGAELVDFFTTGNTHQQSSSQVCQAANFPRAAAVDISNVKFLLAVSGNGALVARIHSDPDMDPPHQVLLYSHGLPDVSDPDNPTACTIELKATLSLAAEVALVSLSNDGVWLTVATSAEVTLYKVEYLTNGGGVAIEHYATTV